MKRDAPSLAALEWPAILEQLAGQATSSLGRRFCLNLKPASDLDQAGLLQRQTQEMRHLLEQEGGVPLGGIRDLDSLYQEIDKGRLLSPTQLLDILDTLRATHRLQRFGLNKRELIPTLWHLFALLVPTEDLEHAIQQSIQPDGTLPDHASENLNQIRSRLRRQTQQIRSQLAALMNKHRNLTHNPTVLQREGRFVIPIKAGGQSEIKGLIHDYSASGATIYLEPLAILADNNALRKEISREKEEENRILFELTQQVKRRLEILQMNLSLLGQLDGICAKAAYAILLKGISPQFNRQHHVLLEQIRHPLLLHELGADHVVPVTLDLPAGLKTLIVTGPNTGGKTVALKTLGLTALMAQSGLQIPAEKALLPVFTQVLAVIGDAQDLLQNLSTFSAHIRQIRRILETAEAASLILIDEITTGTDPLEGSALARALIAALTETSGKVMVTTHYGSLTSLALFDSRIQNASVAFDLETLQPTYHLLQGHPGRSHGLNIAERLGIPGPVLAQARQWLGQHHQEAETVLGKLEDQSRQVHQKQQELKRKEQELKQLEAAYQQKLQHIEQERVKLRTQAAEGFQRELDEARQTLKTLIRDLQRGKPQLREVQRIQQQIEQVAAKRAPPPRSPLAPVDAARLKRGDWLFIPHMNQYGELLELPDRHGQVTVLCNQLKLKVLVDMIQLSSRRQEKKGETSGVTVRTFTAAERECDLHQLRIFEALPKLEKFLDTAYQANLDRVYIIHGKGDGTLKRAVHDYLKQSPYLQSFRLGRSGEGDDGVTVAELV